MILQSIRKTIVRAMTTSSSTKPVPIHRLPLAQRTLQGGLTQLPLDPEPSAQRRSTTFPAASRGVWARTLPLWTEWPLRVTKQEALAMGVDVEKGQGVSVEDVLGRWDPADIEVAAAENGNGLGVTSSAHRLKIEPVLLGIAEEGRKELLPHLAVGVDLNAEDEAGSSLVDILSGRKILSSETYGPYSTRYCGHQFGQWAGQLGDGRAITLLETESEAGRCEIQVKGAGRTPFSRQADGLAVLRSGVREYLGAEAVAALGIPSTRSLAILTSPVVVIREYGAEPSSLVARIAPSFIRIGHFEALNPGEAGRNLRQVFLGGGWHGEVDKPDPNDPLQGQGNLEGLRELVMWVKDGVMGMRDKSVKDWFLEVVKKNGETTALWQVYGFMHGVLNTDNISIMGLTIDYGPYAFMDVWDQNHICRLYSYKNQPNRVLFALDSLASALLPVIGYEAKHGAAPKEGWANDVGADSVREWEAEGLKAIEGWNTIYNDTLHDAERTGWHKRLGLKTFRETDERDIIRDLLSTLHSHSADFGSSFRRLSFFDTARAAAADAGAAKAYVREFAKAWVAAAAADLPSDSVSRAEEGFEGWLNVYASRVSAPEEVEAWASAGGAKGRHDAMTQANPRFVLRQWVLEDTIKRMEDAIKAGDIPEARTVLARVLDMATNPYEPYGEDAEGNVSTAVCDGDSVEQARLCGLGPKTMIGFQCSCSS